MPPKTAVKYDLNEICTGCCQISRISFGGKKFAFELPKVPDLAKYVKKSQKLLHCFGNLKSEALNFRIEFACSIRQTLWKSDSKKPH